MSEESIVNERGTKIVNITTFLKHTKLENYYNISATHGPSGFLCLKKELGDDEGDDTLWPSKK